MDEQQLRIRPMTLDDLPLVGRWLHDPRVAEWWSDEPDAELADIERELGSGGTTIYRIVELGDRPIGMVFRYRIDDYVEYVHELAAARVDIPEHAWSMDYLLGEGDTVGRGIGTSMIRAACDELWSSESTATSVMVAVHADNSRSWRALQRAGFERTPGIFEMEPDTAAHDGRHVIYSLRRQDERLFQQGIAT